MVFLSVKRNLSVKENLEIKNFNIQNNLQDIKYIKSNFNNYDLIIDVRTKQEYNDSKKLLNSYGIHNLPHEDILQNKKIKINNMLIDKNAKILLYCRSGRRSSIIAKHLQKNGYVNINVINKGGFEELNSKILS